MAFHEEGTRVVALAVHSGWLIRTPTELSYAKGPIMPSLMETKPSSAALAEDLADSAQKLLTVESHLKDIGAALASRGDEGGKDFKTLQAELEAIQTELNGVNATLLRAHFASGSALLRLSLACKAALIDAARAAQIIQIIGGADATGSRVLNEDLALKRAASVKSLLVEGGVSPDRVTVSSAAEAYVSSNTTAQGRAQNRRVDVYLKGAEGMPVRLIVNTGHDPGHPKDHL